jgi:hypothetical protein
MLILKRNFNMGSRPPAWRATPSAMRLCAALSVTLALAIDVAHAAPARVNAPAAQSARAPDTVAIEFYGWYLDALSADQDPLSDRYERFNTYVARDLTKSLVERLQTRPVPQSDYFLQTSAWQPAWRRGVRAVVLRRDRAAAEVLVTLSGFEAPTQALMLSMVLENGAWKIRRVMPAHTAAGSSAEQPVI